MNLASGVQICELGNQRVTKATMTVLLEHGYTPDYYDLWSVLQSMAVTPSPALASGKKVFERLGFRHAPQLAEGHILNTSHVQACIGICYRDSGLGFRV